MQLYWGDLHNHCGISYGYGSLENALAAAKEQLDFCAVIGHASWPDIPERKEGLEFLIDFHKEGFAKLASHWEEVRNKVKQANISHEFVTFQGYEVHSSYYGDHHFLSTDDDLPLIEGRSPAEIVSKHSPRPVIAVPHHVGYTPGYRGTNWDTFNSRISPIVETFSKHGSSMSDQHIYPYLHDMGPRDSRGTIFSGLKRGYRFGFVGSTDHHAGYPGSYGDGRLAVLAEEKTRESIWDAIVNRRTYAVTGDKIKCRFKVNDHEMGSEIVDSGSRKVELDVAACNAIDKVIVYKNLRPWKVMGGGIEKPDPRPSNTYKIKLEMGWGTSDTGFPWEGEVSVENGKLADIETCFRGRSVLAPAPNMKDSPDMNALGNKLVKQNSSNVQWTCTTFKNPTTMHPHTAAIILEVEGNERTALNVHLNGKHMAITIEELLNGSRSMHLEDYNSEAFLIHRAVSESEYRFNGEWEDTEIVSECDVYHAEVRQADGQCAWISPVFVLS